MSENIIKIHNASTNEVIEREMTKAELAQWQSDQEAAQAEILAKATAKQAILDKLGLTEEELKIALG
jgi:ParB-like chromosome segregation protein Spo0J